MGSTLPGAPGAPGARGDLEVLRRRSLRKAKPDNSTEGAMSFVCRVATTAYCPLAAGQGKQTRGARVAGGVRSSVREREKKGMASCIVPE